jgi:hypothetical protein
MGGIILIYKQVTWKIFAVATVVDTVFVCTGIYLAGAPEKTTLLRTTS